MIEAKWTGKYPCLCHGEWKLRIDGKSYSSVIPDAIRIMPMDTHGTYVRWYFVDWQEEFEQYEDGMEADEWIKTNASWLKNLPADPHEVFEAFQEQDFRLNSCGGCI